MAQQNVGRELWERMLSFVEHDDHLPVYECRPWTIRKLFFLSHYLAITTRAMAGKNFNAINYVDLFCGPGVDSVRQQGMPRRYPGSPLLAAGCRKPFTNLFLADADASALDAAVERLRMLGCRSHVRSWLGDANTVIDDLASRIPAGSLSIAFIDPYSLGIDFRTVKTLAAKGAVDLIILFADRMDIGRNLDAYYASGKSPKLDRLMGEGSNWLEEYRALKNQAPDRVREFFVRKYLRQLRKVGYHYSRTKTIFFEAGPLYRLVYASKNEVGLKFWDIACGYDLDGSQDLWGV